MSLVLFRSAIFCLMWLYRIGASPRALLSGTDVPRGVVDYVLSPNNGVYVSVVSGWEVSIKHHRAPETMAVGGREFLADCDDVGYVLLPVEPTHIAAYESLDLAAGDAAAHKDPFDRLLIAQAKAEGMMLFTHDSKLSCYDEPCVWRF